MKKCQPAVTTSLSERLCQTPLEELWREEEILKAHRVGYVDVVYIKQALRREEAIRFVLASTGRTLQWFERQEALLLWNEIKHNICEYPEVEGCRLEDFPGQQCFLAVCWRLETGGTVIVFEHLH